MLFSFPTFSRFQSQDLLLLLLLITIIIIIIVVVVVVVVVIVKCSICFFDQGKRFFEDGELIFIGIKTNKICTMHLDKEFSCS